MTGLLIAWKWCVAHWRWFAIAAAVIAAFWMLGLIKHWHTDSTVKLPKVTEALAAELACVEASECRKRLARAEAEAARKQKETDQEVIDGYVEGLKVVSDYAASHPAPSIRLCRPATPSNLRVSKSAAGVDGAAAPGNDEVEIGQDIGRELYEAADALDREVVKLTCLQKWAAAVATKGGT